MHKLFYKIVFSRDVSFVDIFSSRALVLQRKDGKNRGDVAEATRGALCADKTRIFGVDL